MLDLVVTDTAAEAAPAMAVQIRLMSDDPAAVVAAAHRLAKAGFVAITGSTPNRRGPGIRVYGVVANG